MKINVCHELIFSRNELYNTKYLRNYIPRIFTEALHYGDRYKTMQINSVKDGRELLAFEESNELIGPKFSSHEVRPMNCRLFTQVICW